MQKLLKLSLTITGAILLLWIILPLIWGLCSEDKVGHSYILAMAFLMNRLTSQFSLGMLLLPLPIAGGMWVFARFIEPEIEKQKNKLEEVTEKAIHEGLLAKQKQYDLEEEFKDKFKEAKKAIREEEEARLAKKSNQLEKEKIALHDAYKRIEEREAKVKIYIAQKREAEKAVARKNDELHTLWGVINGAREELENGKQEYALKILTRDKHRRKRPPR